MRTKVRLGMEQSPPTCPANPLVSAHPRCMQYGETAINCAARNKKWDLVRLLLDRKADANFAGMVRLTMECLGLIMPVLVLGLAVRVRASVGISFRVSIRVWVRVRVWVRCYELGIG